MAKSQKKTNREAKKPKMKKEPEVKVMPGQLLKGALTPVSLPKKKG